MSSEPMMENELFERVAKYNCTMSMVRLMLKDGLLSEEEYTKIDRIVASDYSLDLSVIYR